jgi:hypothetical protein
MERAFGESFADVTVHTDGGDAAAAARAGAAAVTHGDHVVFAAGRYSPGSLSGRMLLAHELTHVVQQRRGSATSRPAAANPRAENEADTAAADLAFGKSASVRQTVAIGPARSGPSRWEWLRNAAREEVRRRTGEALGQVEGVVMEAATMVDTVAWAGTRGVQAVDATVRRASNAAGLSPTQSAIAQTVVSTLVDTVVPAAPAFRAVQSLATATHTTDPVTGTVSVSGLVTRGFDAVDRARVAVVGQGRPEYGILTARELGQLEGALGSQVALMFVDAEEVQLLLRGVAALGAIQSIERAIDANPTGWMHDREFWLAVGQAVLFVVGLHASSSGRKLVELLADVGMASLATAGPVMKLADDWRSYHADDREHRIQQDIQGVVRALGQGLITVFNHARQARSTRPSGHPAAPAASVHDATVAPVDAASPVVASPAVDPGAPTPIERGRSYPRSATSAAQEAGLASHPLGGNTEPTRLPVQHVAAVPSELEVPLGMTGTGDTAADGAGSATGSRADRPMASAADRPGGGGRGGGGGGGSQRPPHPAGSDVTPTRGSGPGRSRRTRSPSGTSEQPEPDAAGSTSRSAGSRSRGRRGGPVEIGLRSRISAAREQIEAMSSHENAERWDDRLRAIDATAGSEPARARQELAALERDLDVASSGAAGHTQLMPDLPEDIGIPPSRHAVHEPGEEQAVQLDATSPRARDRTGALLLEHLRLAVARFNRDGLTDAQTAAVNQAERNGRRSPLRDAYRGARIDEFCKLTVMGDRRLDHVHVTGLYERGADFLDSRTGTWYDMTTVAAWKAHVAQYGPMGRRLPTEPVR